MPPCLTTFFYSPAASPIFAGEFFVFIGTCAIIKSKMNSDEFYEFEDRAYLNPTLSSGEQEAFINNLRNTQNQNNAQIAEQTYNLGTEVPSNLGGLGGGESYFTSRYQTPQVGEMVETLKTAAQAQALNDVMTNYKNQLQNRYKQAYRAYSKRNRGTGGTGTGGGGDDGSTDGKINIHSDGTEYTSDAEKLALEAEKHRIEQENLKKAREEAAKRAEKVNQALNPQTNLVTNPQDAIDYWKNIRR